jgi:UDP-N-acetylmuramoyl-tripeptide--D-alanyl-D-alanine ligase
LLSINAVNAFGVSGCHFNNIEMLLAALDALIDAQSTVLVKGSRFMKMERVVKFLESGEAVNNAMQGKA